MGSILFKINLNARDVEAIGDIFHCTNKQTGNLERKKSTKYKVSRTYKVHIIMFLARIGVTKKTREVTL